MLLARGAGERSARRALLSSIISEESSSIRGTKTSEVRERAEVSSYFLRNVFWEIVWIYSSCRSQEPMRVCWSHCVNIDIDTFGHITWLFVTLQRTHTHLYGPHNRPLCKGINYR
ncbi:hypothetical protein QQF64_013853 [Cirrhinus molitorella]|uniref:Uncharacterized protein n=1 Tax=Cirrhinus molitorella TaxID=172907 RepID=A0ABR3LVX1_9TELE